ncbi:hypothetical protein, partial [Roseisolibacter sp. H3M3-2]|uniref:hypothetical protein n=1 Tax=Roseisolibacter sp. H3M3-2 TaxID=3031323 RepID=UPI0023DA68DB
MGAGRASARDGGRRLLLPGRRYARGAVLFGAAAARRDRWRATLADAVDVALDADDHATASCDLVVVVDLDAPRLAVARALVAPGGALLLSWDGAAA